MRLIAELERALAAEQSLFRAQLLREDLARLARLPALAASAADAAAFRQAGAKVGWTQGDARTHELREPLELFLDEVYAWERGERTRERDAAIADAWERLHRVRMERLLGCLSTPVPRPDD
ncbi:MAG TPA: hypothetical protein VG873_16565 [Burkholderiales bacterium]|jgi:hypothetical protein|nr:hypothetical protein [Burkholderiales bacterium]